MHIVDIRGINTKNGCSLGLLARANRAIVKVKEAFDNQPIFAICCELSQLENEELEGLLYSGGELIGNQQLNRLHLELTMRCELVNSTRSKQRHKTTGPIKISAAGFRDRPDCGMVFLTMPEQIESDDATCFLVIARHKDEPRLTADDLYYFSSFADISW